MSKTYRIINTIKFRYRSTGIINLLRAIDHHMLLNFIPHKEVRWLLKQSGLRMYHRYLLKMPVTTSRKKLFWINYFELVNGKVMIWEHGSWSINADSEIVLSWPWFCFGDRDFSWSDWPEVVNKYALLYDIGIHVRKHAWLFMSLEKELC